MHEAKKKNQYKIKTIKLSKKKSFLRIASAVVFLISLPVWV